MQVQLKVTVGFIDMDGTRGPLEIVFSLKGHSTTALCVQEFFFFLMTSGMQMMNRRKVKA